MTKREALGVIAARGSDAGQGVDRLYHVVGGDLAHDLGYFATMHSALDFSLGLSATQKVNVVIWRAFIVSGKPTGWQIIRRAVV